MQAWEQELSRYEAVRVEELPGALGLLAGHVKPLATMFPHDWVEMMALTFWSAMVPASARIENLGLNLWYLGLNPQGSGKNITSDEMYKVVRATFQLQERDMVLFTGGSAEGMARKLEGEGRSLLAYHREYAGFLRNLKQMSGSKEVMMNLYDGADISHQLSQSSVGVRDPHVTVVATTTMDAITETGSKEDLVNGYLSRFLFCAPNSLDVAPGPFPTEHQRYGLALLLVDMLGEVAGVEGMTCDYPAERVLGGYMAEVGLYTGRVRDLDHERGNQDTPPGRLVARAKKIAALLALADGRGAIVAGDMALAIRFTERAGAYQRRVARWITMDIGDETLGRVTRWLEQNKEPVDARFLQQRARANSRLVHEALAVLMERGDVTSEKVGQRTVYSWIKKER